MFDKKKKKDIEKNKESDENKVELNKDEKIYDPEHKEELEKKDKPVLRKLQKFN